MFPLIVLNSFKIKLTKNMFHDMMTPILREDRRGKYLYWMRACGGGESIGEGEGHKGFIDVVATDGEGSQQGV